jgi:hypothetical protein
MAGQDSNDLWTLLETPPDGCGAVADLWHWSTNFSAGKGPATLFLDMIGESEDRFGVNVYDGFDTGHSSLGFVELHKLGLALCEYADRPHDVREFVAALLAAEECE